MPARFQEATHDPDWWSMYMPLPGDKDPTDKVLMDFSRAAMQAFYMLPAFGVRLQRAEVEKVWWTAPDGEGRYFLLLTFRRWVGDPESIHDFKADEIMKVRQTRGLKS